MNRIIAVFAFVTLAAFLAILLIRLPRPDLICLVAITLLLAGWDTVVGLREHQDPGQK